MYKVLQYDLSHEKVHVWTFSLESAKFLVGDLQQLLSPDEIVKSQRFRFECDRWQYIVCRGLLRKLLGSYLNILPQDIIFSYGKYGKPTLSAAKLHGSDLQFNISHSKGLAVMAFALKCQVGIDLEWVNSSIDYLAISQNFFSPAEVSCLQILPDSLQLDAFFNCWTQKEAFIKARGDGLFLPLHHFDVSVDPRQEPRLVFFRFSPQETLNWKMYRISLKTNYFCTLSAEGPIKKIIINSLLDNLNIIN